MDGLTEGKEQVMIMVKFSFVNEALDLNVVDQDSNLASTYELCGFAKTDLSV